MKSIIIFLVLCLLPLSGKTTEAEVREFLAEYSEKMNAKEVFRVNEMHAGHCSFVSVGKARKGTQLFGTKGTLHLSKLRNAFADLDLYEFHIQPAHIQIMDGEICAVVIAKVQENVAKKGEAPEIYFHDYILFMVREEEQLKLLQAVMQPTQAPSP